MENKIISKEITRSLKDLTQTEQKKVLEYIRSLLKKKKGNSDFLKYFGSIDKEDAESMKNAI